MKHETIAAIQGTGLLSPLSGQRVVTRGVVTGLSRRGWFLQDPEGGGGEASTGLFVFAPRRPAPLGARVEVQGEVVDHLASEHDRPTTQLKLGRWRKLDRRGPEIEPVWIDAGFLDRPLADVVAALNRLEGMLVGLPADSVFIAPSNPFGDYVLLPPGTSAPITRHGGVRIDPEQPLRWYPGFRVLDYDRAPRLDVGARLLRPVTGPLNYRASSYQIATREERVEIGPAPTIEVSTMPAPERPSQLDVLTLNGFNLDPRREDPSRVKDPRRDVDDDVADGRYRMLARAVVEEAGAPHVVALQEMQDDDGAEITGNVDARRNYERLVRDIESAGGPRYRWAEIAPKAQADGGQPGGNIRNAFLYDPERVDLVDATLRRLGEEDPAFVDSRKPLAARFRLRATGAEIEILDLHLASKRHQYPVFAPDRPGFDPRERVRVEQARVVRTELDRLEAEGYDYYVTGDFNDHEFSDTLRTLVGSTAVDLVEHVEPDERYDYNHRGVLQTLMHGVVPRRLYESGRALYHILHGNELVGSTPGRLGDRPTDHAYVLARLELPAPGQDVENTGSGAEAGSPDR